jgi:hypothetical protein
MKRHLCEAHDIQNVSVQLPEVKNEPLELELDGESVTKELEDERDECDERDDHDITENGDGEDDSLVEESSEAVDKVPVDEIAVDENQEKRVPPLRVKLHGGNLNSPDASPTASLVQPANGKPATAPTLSCSLCGHFTTNNSYILGRHKKSCLKRKKDLSRKSISGDEGIEVAVEFNNANGIEETE